MATVIIFTSGCVKLEEINYLESENANNASPNAGSNTISERDTVRKPTFPYGSYWCPGTPNPVALRRDCNNMKVVRYKVCGCSVNFISNFNSISPGSRLLFEEETCSRMRVIDVYIPDPIKTSDPNVQSCSGYSALYNENWNFLDSNSGNRYEPISGSVETGALPHARTLSSLNGRTQINWTASSSSTYLTYFELTLPNATQSGSFVNFQVGGQLGARAYEVSYSIVNDNDHCP